MMSALIFVYNLAYQANSLVNFVVWNSRKAQTELTLFRRHYANRIIGKILFDFLAVNVKIQLDFNLKRSFVKYKFTALKVLFNALYNCFALFKINAARFS